MNKPSGPTRNGMSTANLFKLKSISRAPLSERLQGSEKFIKREENDRMAALSNTAKNAPDVISTNQDNEIHHDQSCKWITMDTSQSCHLTIPGKKDPELSRLENKEKTHKTVLEGKDYSLQHDVSLRLSQNNSLIQTQPKNENMRVIISKKFVPLFRPKIKSKFQKEEGTCFVRSKSHQILPDSDCGPLVPRFKPQNPQKLSSLPCESTLSKTGHTKKIQPIRKFLRLSERSAIGEGKNAPSNVFQHQKLFTCNDVKDCNQLYSLDEIGSAQKKIFTPTAPIFSKACDIKTKSCVFTSSGQISRAPMFKVATPAPQVQHSPKKCSSDSKREATSKSITGFVNMTKTNSAILNSSTPFSISTAGWMTQISEENEFECLLSAPISRDIKRKKDSEVKYNHSS